ncbi:hypothetical protein [Nonomuraea sp. NPDC023979]|uniref:hypothetical protein n=1 Tax=Nonomuraea sp. NPDC023979 TaxID=3154796 RepID=UPI0033EEC2F8
MYEDLDASATERLWPCSDGDQVGRQIADNVAKHTGGRWLAVWGSYSQALTLFWRGPAPRGGYCFQTGLDSVWDSIAAAELEMALQYPFGPPLTWR